MENCAVAKAATRPKRAFFNWRFVRVWSEHRKLNWIGFLLFWSILNWYFVKTHVVGVGIVTDISMRPTLAKGYYVVNRYIYNFVRPERGDIVIFRRGAYEHQEEVKRVIGLPRETLLINGGTVYINGRPLDEPYAVGPTYPDLGPVTLGKDSYYLLGDTRWMREDSRDFGAVPLKNILGKISPDQVFPFR